MQPSPKLGQPKSRALEVNTQPSPKLGQNKSHALEVNMQPAQNWGKQKSCTGGEHATRPYGHNIGSPPAQNCGTRKSCTKSEHAALPAQNCGNPFGLNLAALPAQNCGNHLAATWQLSLASTWQAQQPQLGSKLTASRHNTFTAFCQYNKFDYRSPKITFAT